MIRIPTGLFGLIGFLPRLPPASTSRPQRNAAPAWAMRSAYASQQSPTRRESPHAWLRKCLNSARAAAHSSTGRPAANRLGNPGWHRGIAPPRTTLGAHLGGGLGPASSCWGATGYAGWRH